MNSIERVFNRLEGKQVDRVPNLNIIMQFAARYIGVPYGKYCTDYRYLVEGNIKCCREFGIDMVSVISDPFRETSGFGVEITINHDDVPSCKDYLIKEYGDIRKIKATNPLNSVRMLDRVKAIELYKESIGNEFPILGWVEGAFAEACDLRGINNIMTDIYDNPDFIIDLMEICLDQAIRFSKEQINAGAHFIGIGDAAGSLISPETYRNIVLPFEKRLCEEIHGMGAKAKLHICGNISHILKYIPLTTADIVDIDWMVNFREAVECLSGNTCACGNFDPVKILLNGSVSDVKNSVKDCLKVSDINTFISAGCEVPKYTSHENLRAVYETLCDDDF